MVNPLKKKNKKNKMNTNCPQSTASESSSTGEELQNRHTDRQDLQQPDQRTVNSSAGASSRPAGGDSRDASSSETETSTNAENRKIDASNEGGAPATVQETPETCPTPLKAPQSSGTDENELRDRRLDQGDGQCLKESDHRPVNSSAGASSRPAGGDSRDASSSETETSTNAENRKIDDSNEGGAPATVQETPETCPTPLKAPQSSGTDENELRNHGLDQGDGQCLKESDHRPVNSSAGASSRPAGGDSRDASSSETETSTNAENRKIDDSNEGGAPNTVQETHETCPTPPNASQSSRTDENELRNRRPDQGDGRDVKESDHRSVSSSRPAGGDSRDASSSETETPAVELTEGKSVDVCIIGECSSSLANFCLQLCQNYGLSAKQVEHNAKLIKSEKQGRSIICDNGDQVICSLMIYAKDTKDEEMELPSTENWYRGIYDRLDNGREMAVVRSEDEARWLIHNWAGLPLSGQDLPCHDFKALVTDSWKELKNLKNSVSFSVWRFSCVFSFDSDEREIAIGRLYGPWTDHHLKRPICRRWFREVNRKVVGSQLGKLSNRILGLMCLVFALVMSNFGFHQGGLLINCIFIVIFLLVGYVWM